MRNVLALTLKSKFNFDPQKFLYCNSPRSITTVLMYWRILFRLPERSEAATQTTPSIVYKRHAIRDTSQIFEKNKRQRLVSAIDLRDSWHTTFQETFAVTSQNWLAKRQKICWFLLHWVKKLSHFWDSSFLVWFGQTFTFASNLFQMFHEKNFFIHKR